MFNPLNDSNSPLSSRIALSGALLLAGIFGLGAALILPVKKFTNDTVSQDPLPATLKTPAQGLPEEPAQVVLPAASTDDLIRFCSSNVTETRSFVIFHTGTAVIVNEPCQDPLEEAKKKLAACVAPDVRFISEPTREGDLIVTFNQPVFHHFSGKEISETSLWLSNAATSLLTPAERASVSEDWSPNRNARFGLLARRRMLEDAANPVPVRIVRAKYRAMAAN